MATPAPVPKKRKAIQEADPPAPSVKSMIEAHLIPDLANIVMGYTGFEENQALVNEIQQCITASATDFAKQIEKILDRYERDHCPHTFYFCFYHEERGVRHEWSDIQTNPVLRRYCEAFQWCLPWEEPTDLEETYYAKTVLVPSHRQWDHPLLRLNAPDHWDKNLMVMNATREFRALLDLPAEWVDYKQFKPFQDVRAFLQYRRMDEPGYQRNPYDPDDDDQTEEDETIEMERLQWVIPAAIEVFKRSLQGRWNTGDKLPPEYYRYRNDQKHA